LSTFENLNVLFKEKKEGRRKKERKEGRKKNKEEKETKSGIHNLEIWIPNSSLTFKLFPNPPELESLNVFSFSFFLCYQFSALKEDSIISNGLINSPTPGTLHSKTVEQLNG
jgi:hypothetical protein